MTKIPDKIEIDCKVTSTGYLQVDQWSAKDGIRPPPVNGNRRETYYHERVVEQLRKERDELAKFIMGEGKRSECYPLAKRIIENGNA